MKLRTGQFSCSLASTHCSFADEPKLRLDQISAGAADLLSPFPTPPNSFAFFLGCQDSHQVQEFPFQALLLNLKS